MRTVRVALVVAFTSLVAHSAAAQGSPGDAAWSEIVVAGAPQGEQAYRLALEYEPAGGTGYAAILVVAEPSRALLLAHVATGSRSAEGRILAGEVPFAQTEGVMGASNPRVIVSRPQPALDGVLVYGVEHDGTRHLLAAARVVSETFSIRTLTRGFPVPESIQHCCTCTGCERKCVDCVGSYFSCNCVTCTIECGW